MKRRRFDWELLLMSLLFGVGITYFIVLLLISLGG
jgi:hypothetical protein